LLAGGDGIDLEPERAASFGQELTGEGIVVGDEDALDGQG
jgi:hypothetical protein